jgi:phytoene desaturase
MTEIVVVGAGPGGLASAMLLARTGAKVTLLERLPTVGGRSRALKKDGFTFDTGPTFFLYPQILAEIFAWCGFDLHADVEMTRLDPLYDLRFGLKNSRAEMLRIHADPVKLAEEIAKFSPHDAANVSKFLAENAQKFAAFAPILQRPFSGVADLFKGDMLKALPWLAPWRSVDADLGRFFADPRVRLAFSFQSKYLGMSPFNCPSLFTILAYLEHAHGVWHPTGGCNALMTAMERRARAMGVEMKLSHEVQGFTYAGRRVNGVQVRDAAGQAHTLKADAVVLNADFAHAMRHLVPNDKRARWHDSKLEKSKYSCSTFMLYLGLKGRYDDLAHHTICLADDYRGNLADITAGTRLPVEPSLYMQNASVTDATLAPEGHSTLYVLVPVAHENGHIDWAKEAPGFRNRIVRRLQDLGLKDLPNRIVQETVMTPTGWREDLHVFNGATFNLAHTLDQMLLFRPHNRFEDVDGMYLVGGGTHPGSGLPVIFESAKMSSQLLAADLHLPNPMRANA